MDRYLEYDVQFLEYDVQLFFNYSLISIYADKAFIRHVKKKKEGEALADDI